MTKPNKALRTGRSLQPAGIQGEQASPLVDGEALSNLAELRYKILVETMSDGLHEIDAAYRSTYANKRMCDILGYQLQEIIGRPIADFMDVRSKKEFFSRLQRQEKESDYSSYELIWIRKNGRKIHTNISPAPLFDRFGQLKGSFAVITDLSERRKLEEALRKAQEELEHRVRERTLELELKTNDLEEVNTALKVLLKKREEDKFELKRTMVFNVKKLVSPYLDKLKATRLDNRQAAFMDIIESALDDINSNLMHELSNNYPNLTPAEIQIADMIKQGKTTKEIAALLRISSQTIEGHRKNIRKKIGIQHKKVNLRAYFLSAHHWG